MRFSLLNMLGIIAALPVSVGCVIAVLAGIAGALTVALSVLGWTLFQNPDHTPSNATIIAAEALFVVVVPGVPVVILTGDFLAFLTRKQPAPNGDRH